MVRVSEDGTVVDVEQNKFEIDGRTYTSKEALVLIKHKKEYANSLEDQIKEDETIYENFVICTENKIEKLKHLLEDQRVEHNQIRDSMECEIHYVREEITKLEEMVACAAGSFCNYKTLTPALFEKARWDEDENAFDYKITKAFAYYDGYRFGTQMTMLSTHVLRHKAHQLYQETKKYSNIFKLWSKFSAQVIDYRPELGMIFISDIAESNRDMIQFNICTNEFYYTVLVNWEEKSGKGKLEDVVRDANEALIYLTHKYKLKI
jgi:hypothetical protein